MELTWLGHSCFRLRGREAVVVTDPPQPALGYALARLGGGTNAAPNIVTVSHGHPGHNYLDIGGAESKVLTGPGEYEIAGVFVTGLATYHDDSSGAKRGRNIVFAITLDDVTVVHLGDLGHLLSASQIEQLPEIDVLLTPVGGVSTIDGAQAAELVAQLQPRLVVPMHFQTDMEHTQRLEKADRFLREIGQREAVPQGRLNVTRSNLPNPTQVVLLEALGIKGAVR